MTEYVLILTLIGYSSQSGQAIEHIGGFATQAQCLDAGNAWLASVRMANANRLTRANCVARTIPDRK